MKTFCIWIKIFYTYFIISHSFNYRYIIMIIISNFNFIDFINQSKNKVSPWEFWCHERARLQILLAKRHENGGFCLVSISYCNSAHLLHEQLVCAQSGVARTGRSSQSDLCFWAHRKTSPRSSQVRPEASCQGRGIFLSQSLSCTSISISEKSRGMGNALSNPTSIVLSSTKVSNSTWESMH